MGRFGASGLGAGAGTGAGASSSSVLAVEESATAGAGLGEGRGGSVDLGVVSSGVDGISGFADFEPGFSTILKKNKHTDHYKITNYLS